MATRLYYDVMYTLNDGTEHERSFMSKDAAIHFAEGLVPTALAIVVWYNKWGHERIVWVP